jgi:hypothetical protein
MDSNQQTFMDLWKGYDYGHRVALLSIAQGANGSHEANFLSGADINAHSAGDNNWNPGYEAQFGADVRAALTKAGYDFHWARDHAKSGKDRQDQPQPHHKKRG